MLISRTPLRISFLGGGTDFPWFFEEHGGAVISAAIDKHIYINGLRSYDQRTFYLKYSELEIVKELSSIRHPIFRTALEHFEAPPLDISVMAEIPAGNGLASSSAFSVGLINLIFAYRGQNLSQSQLAELAIKLELDLLNEPIGVQDQLGSAFGGVNFHQFSAGRTINSRSLFTDNNPLPFDMMLSKVGVASRQASSFTAAQKDYVAANPAAIRALEELRDLTLEAERAMANDPSALPQYIREGWLLKLASNPNAASNEILSLSETLVEEGALATKLLGAGGGGFILSIFKPGHLPEFLARNETIGRISTQVKIDYRGAVVMEV
jgi:D-glycero-alpha-D-manno-heptose-7-phosphate kinase